MTHEKHSESRDQKNILQRAEELYRLHLFPGTYLDKLNEKVFARIEHRTQWCTIPTSCVLSSTSEELIVSLYKWCGEIFVDASTRAFYGDELVDSEPMMVQDFLEFDKHDWMLLYQTPSFLAKKMSAPRERVLQSFVRYLSLPPHWTEDSPARGLHNLNTEFDMSSRDGATFLQMFHFAMNTNIYKSCFWLLAHIIFEPSSLSAIRTEITPAIRGEKMDIHYLVEEQKCPMLNAALNETLRYTTGASTGRGVLSPTNIGTKTLYPGATVLVPYRQGLFSDVFGPNVLDFDPHRFVQDPGLVKNPAYRPFGGGEKYCPGRFLTRREVVGFVALVLDRFDIELHNHHTEPKAQPQFPRLDVNKPSAGIIAPAPGDDVMVSIRPRKADPA